MIERIRTDFWKAFTVVFVLALIWACGGSSDEDDDDDATSTPVAEVINIKYDITSARVAETGEGLDLDGDGDKDNNIEKALELINETLYAAAETVINESELPEECSSEALVCKELLTSQVETLIDQVFSMESLNTAVSESIESGDLDFSMYFNGAIGEDTVVKWEEDELRAIEGDAKQTGIPDENLLGLYGPSTLVLELSVDVYDPTTAHWVTLEIPATFQNWYTEVNGNDGYVIDFISGAAVSVEDLMAIAWEFTDVLDALLTAAELDIDAETTLELLEASLRLAADVDTDDNGRNDSFSGAVVGTAEW